jgi:AcrR family transcriptional regulator
MSPRPRLMPDSDVVTGVARVIERLGPSRFTLSDVSKEIGLAPATLVQRFGSKRGLLLAVARTAASGVHEQFAHFRATSRSPLQTIEAIARCMAGMAKTPEALANHLAFLEMDLADRDFHRMALAHARQFQAELRALLDEAVRTGEIRRFPTARLALAIQAMISGSLLAWAIHRDGKAEATVLANLETLLRPYRTAARRTN